MTQVGVESIAWYRHEQTVDGERDRARARGAGGRDGRREPGEPVAVSMGINAERFKYVADVARRGGRASRRCSTACAVRADRRGRRDPRRHHREQVRPRGRSSRSASSTRPATPTSRRAPAPRTARRRSEEMLAASVMFSMTGVNKRKFLDEVKADPQTYRDWAGNAEWDIETTGKEDELFSPFLRKPFKQAVEAGLIPPNLITLAGTWGTITRPGRPHVPQPRPPGRDRRHRRRRPDPRRDRGPASRRCTRSRRCARFMPGCEDAKLRNFGMTIGIRDTRKIDGALRPDRDGRPRAGPVRRFDRHLPRVHRRLRRPHPADDRPLLPGAVPLARAARASAT